jgi:hypothetical protein
MDIESGAMSHDIARRLESSEIVCDIRFIFKGDFLQNRDDFNRLNTSVDVPIIFYFRKYSSQQSSALLIFDFPLKRKKSLHPLNRFCISTFSSRDIRV